MVHTAGLSGARMVFPRGTPLSYPSPVRLAAKSARMVTNVCRNRAG